MCTTFSRSAKSLRSASWCGGGGRTSGRALPVARRSPAAKLLRKGLPIPNSLRYLGLQFQRACATGGDDILVDVCKAYAFGLCGGEPIEIDALIARWLSTSSALYADTLASMRSVELQAVLGLLQTVVKMDVCNHRLLRAGLSHMDSLGMIDLLRRICKPDAGCVPSGGFGVCMEQADGIEVRRSLLTPSGGGFRQADPGQAAGDAGA